MNAEIKSLPNFEVLGLSLKTLPKSPEIPKLWDAFVARMSEIKNRSEANVSYGVMESDEGMTSLRYMAGVPIDKGATVPEGMKSWNIAAKTYAVFETRLSEISKTFDGIFGSWLPQSEYQTDTGPLLERYGEAFDPEKHPVLEICIPVVKKT